MIAVLFTAVMILVLFGIVARTCYRLGRDTGYEQGKFDGQRLERINTWCGMRRFEPVVKAEWERVN